MVALVRRNRRRYGGYIVHVGIAVLFVGVAASSAFQRARDVQPRPGQTERVGGYEIRYVAPPRGSTPRATGGSSGSTSARCSTCAATAGETLRPERGYYPSHHAGAGPGRRFFEGEATSEVGLKAGLRRDLWTAVAPDIGRAAADRAGRQGVRRRDELSGEERARCSARRSSGSATLHATPPPATFRLIASPLVTWIWIGALIVFVGASIALWPARRRPAPRATAAGLARVARARRARPWSSCPCSSSSRSPCW